MRRSTQFFDRFPCADMHGSSPGMSADGRTTFVIERTQLAHISRRHALTEDGFANYIRSL
jgi:hypothetical protein